MSIVEIMETKGNPTLKAIAAVFDIPTQRIGWNPWWTTGQALTERCE